MNLWFFDFCLLKFYGQVMLQKTFTRLRQTLLYFHNLHCVSFCLSLQFLEKLKIIFRWKTVWLSRLQSSALIVLGVQYWSTFFIYQFLFCSSVLWGIGLPTLLLSSSITSHNYHQCCPLRFQEKSLPFSLYSRWLYFHYFDKGEQINWVNCGRIHNWNFAIDSLYGWAAVSLSCLWAGSRCVTDVKVACSEVMCCRYARNSFK